VSALTTQLGSQEWLNCGRRRAQRKMPIMRQHA
jgi:hypothetical protein